MPRTPMRKFLLGVLTAALMAVGSANAAAPETGAAPSEAKTGPVWALEDRALVIDAYEYNELDWAELAKNKRIAGFINKASDGLPPAYFCSGDEAQYRLCKALWYRHAVSRELYQTRRMLTKSLGLKWGAYHLARPGNPVEQAQNFLDFAKPAPDELMALDLEDNDPAKWMSLDDAEVFVDEIKRRTGRYPVLYTNGSTAKHIADNAGRYKLLSRLQLWYARYKPEVDMHFPKGHWENFALWQFVSQSNCNARVCPMRIGGANRDIDINVADMTPDQLRAAWPFGELVPAKTELLVAETVPVPYPRELALAGDAPVRYAAIDTGALSNAIASVAKSQTSEAVLAYAASAANAGQSAIDRLMGKARGKAAPEIGIDQTVTASIQTKTAQPTSAQPAMAPQPASTPIKAFDRAAAPVDLLTDRATTETFGELFWPDSKPEPAQVARCR